jgi:phage/plasmid-like protein (TIGR03299 family)
MADNLERQPDGTTSFAYNHESGIPWHRTGHSMKGLQTIDAMLEKAKADYEVSVAPLYVISPEGLIVELESRKATVRVNPYTGDFEPLASVGNRYAPVQNREVLERALAIVGASHGDAVVDTLGVLDHGRRFFAAIDLGALVIDPRGVADKIERYLLVYSSHDGTVPIVYANTPIRPVCQNTVTMALDAAQSTFKAKHTPGFAVRIEEAQQVLKLSTEWAREFKVMAEQMLAIPMVGSRFPRVLDAVFPVEKATTTKRMAHRTEVVEKIYTIYGNAKNAAGYGTNGWAAWNSIVEYLDHHREATPEERALTSMDETSWVSKRKLIAQQAVLALG